MVKTGKTLQYTKVHRNIKVCLIIPHQQLTTVTITQWQNVKGVTVSAPLTLNNCECVNGIINFLPQKEQIAV